MKFVGISSSPGGATRKRQDRLRSKHDLVVASGRFHEVAVRIDGKRVSQLARYVRKKSASAPMKDVLDVWSDSLGSRRRNSPFALAVAKAAPEMINRVGQTDAGRIYDLLGETLAKVPRGFQRAAADAILNAVLRTSGDVPAEARRVIRRHRQTLQRYPDVWRYIGSYED